MLYGHKAAGEGGGEKLHKYWRSLYACMQMCNSLVIGPSPFSKSCIDLCIYCFQWD